MISVYCRLAIVFLLLSNCVLASAQQADESPAADPVRDYCAGVSQDIPHAEAFDRFCIWVLSFDTTLPNIIGDQRSIRYRTENGKDRHPIDTTGARIAFLEGRPRYTDIEINHVRIAQTNDDPEKSHLYGAWSYTDYGADLRLLFGSHTKTHFAFSGQSELHGEPVLVFAYDVAVADNMR